MNSADIKRGEIWLVNLDPTVGNEQGKKRPVLVISNDLNNKNSNVITGIPITSKKIDRIYPFEVFLPKESGLSFPSKAMCDHIRAVDKSRFSAKLGIVNDKIMQEIEAALLLHLGMVKI